MERRCGASGAGGVQLLVSPFNPADRLCAGVFMLSRRFGKRALHHGREALGDCTQTDSVTALLQQLDATLLVNTRCSCLCTLDPDYSFVPRWRPPFITALPAEDHCHLKGQALVDNRPGFVEVSKVPPLGIQMRR